MRSKERVKTLGEVFTPLKLVDEVLDKLSPIIWADPSKTICDPAGCGNGNFLVAVIRRKIEAGSSPLQALCTTFGVDIMQDNVSECRERILRQAEESTGQHRDWSWIEAVMSNIVCHDALTYDFSFPPVFISPKSDYLLAHEYALYLVGKRKQYENAHAGARFELAFTRRCPGDVHDQCKAHLERATRGQESHGDWHYDAVINGVRVDFKAAERLKDGSQVHLILDEGKARSDVLYALAETDSFWCINDDPRDMVFRFVGWSMGDAGLFVPSLRCSGKGNKVEAATLNDWESLRAKLGLP